MVTQVKSSNIAVGAITTDQIASGAITIADIPDGEITAGKLHTTLDLSSKTITYPTNSVTSDALHTTAVTDKLGYTPVAPNDSPTFSGLTVDTNTLVVDSANNRVGIGTSSPSVALQVGTSSSQSESKIYTALGGGHISLNNSSVSTANPLIELQRWSGTPSVYYGFQLEADNSDFKISISNAATLGSQTFTERMRIDSSGNVGIGTSSPASNLHVDNSSGNSLIRVSSSDSNIAGIDFGDTSDSDAARIRYYNSDNTLRFSVNGGIEAFRIRSDRRLDVAQPIMYVGSGQAMRCSNSEYVQDAVRASGYIQFGTTIGAVGVNYFTSDANKKENIQPSTYNSSPLVENIQFVEFDWKPDSGEEGHVQVGVTAQQLQTLDERLVAELEDGSFMVKEPALVTHLAKALQEQIQKVKDLETRIQTLENT